MSTTWQTGRASSCGEREELDGEDAEAGMHLLVDRLMPLLASSTSGSPHSEAAEASGARRATVYRIRLSERTGRFEANCVRPVMTPPATKSKGQSRRTGRGSETPAVGDAGV